MSSLELASVQARSRSAKPSLLQGSLKCLARCLSAHTSQARSSQASQTIHVSQVNQVYT